MRKILVFSLVGLFFGVGVVALIEIDPGYVLIAYDNYTVETSLWVGTLVLLLFTLLIYALIRLVRKTLGGRVFVSNWLGTRTSRRGVHLTNRGLINYIEGNWSKSRAQLLRGARGNDAPLLNYLMAARASNQLDEADKMREYLGLAEGSETNAGIAVELTQAEMKLARGQFEQALATLVRARRNAGRHPYVLSLLSKAYRGLEDWPALEELLPDLRKYKVLPEKELTELSGSIHAGLLQRAAENNDSSALNKCWAALPGTVKKESHMIALYCAALIADGSHEEAGKMIARSIKREWSDELVRLYGYVAMGNGAKQLSLAESWLEGQRENAQLLMCLGRLSAANESWGKAREYFELSYKIRREPEVCAELGRLLAGLGEDSVSAAYFREGLLLEVSDLPELPIPGKAVSRAAKLANS
jgi:HemY protein